MTNLRSIKNYIQPAKPLEKINIFNNEILKDDFIQKKGNQSFSKIKPLENKNFLKVGSQVIRKCQYQKIE